MLAPFNTEGKRHSGEGPFAYVELTRLWHRVRYMGCISAIVIGMGLVAAGHVIQGLAVGAGGAAALIDTHHRVRTPTAAIWPALLIDASLIAVGAPLAGLPPASLLAAYAYLGTAALFFVATRTALLVLAYMAVALSASVAVSGATGLDQTLETTAGSVAGGVTWTVFLLSLVWIATRAVESFHSERETVRRRLEDLISEKDTFVATVSHELRTPLTAVIGLSQQLLEADDDFTPIERREMLGLVHSQAAEVGSIIEDLLITARVADGKLDVHPAPIDLNEEVAIVLKSLELTDIVALEPDDGASAYADPARVRQIMRNLVTNAVRHGADPIVVTTGQGQVTVSDHGTGVPVEDRERIFESYGRSGSHHHRDSIGLGLAISRTLATLMGGDLTYERADGKSTFRLTLSVTS